MTSKILVIRFGSLGDVILASAPVQNLRIYYPFSEIFFLTKAKYASVARMIPGVDKVIVTKDSPGIFEYLKLLFELDRQNFEIVIDIQGNARSSLARKFITSSQKLVYARDRAARMRLVNQKNFPANCTHTIDKYNDCIKQLGYHPVAKRPTLETSFDIETQPRKTQVVIAPGASHMNKQWPIEKFADVAQNLSEKLGTHIIWAVTSGDQEKINMTEKLGKEHVSMLIDSSIEKLAEMIHGSELCIANDSGIAHLSSAVGTPVLAIFGPTHPALGFAPRGLCDEVIEVNEYCRPCSLHGDKKCFRSERFCFTKITADSVFDSAKRSIKRIRKSSKALFVDRDGTVIVDKPFDSNPDNIEFESGSIEALKSAQQAGFKIIIVSNQSGIARGYFKIEDAERFNAELVRQLKKQGVKIAAVYFCPHYSDGVVPKYSFACNCRKPAQAMVEKAATEINIDMGRSYVVGDKADDFNLGRIGGMRSFLVKTGQGDNYLEIIGKISKSVDFSAVSNLSEAVDRILKIENSTASEA